MEKTNNKFTDIYENINVNQIPKIEKIVINSGIGRIENSQISDVLKDMIILTCQKPILIKCKKSIAAFKVRRGMIVGAKVTLRKKNADNFLNKLIWIILVKIRDFKGFEKKSINENVLSFGISDLGVFPETISSPTKIVRGLDISIVLTKSKLPDAYYNFFKFLNLPFING